MLSFTLPCEVTVLRLTKVGCSQGSDYKHTEADNMEGLATA